MTTRTCPNAATCPSATLLDDGTWLIVGRQITDAAAREHGGNPADDEAAVLVPQQVIDDAISRPLQARIDELEGERMRLVAQADELRGRIAILSSRSNLARQLADKNDEYDTLKARFDDFRDICSEHSADRVVEQVRLDDAEAALKRYGDEMITKETK